MHALEAAADDIVVALGARHTRGHFRVDLHLRRELRPCPIHLVGAQQRYACPAKLMTAAVLLVAAISVAATHLEIDKDNIEK